tara:strand:- start:139 stop:465 length:327 start_codon:yes stop_codon:yes gene_type:complete
MKLKYILSQKIKQQMLSHAYNNMSSNNDKIRARLKSKHYAQEVTKIRHMSKKQLVKFIDKYNDKPSIILAKKVYAHSSSSYMYRMLDDNIKNDMELYNYAQNRKTCLT